MNLEQYIEQAIRTETYGNDKKSHIKFDQNLLIEILERFITTGEYLDDVKKYIFYKRPTKIIPIVEVLEEDIPVNRRIFHALIGIATESSEVIDALAKHVRGEQPLDLTNLREEMGDLCWYIAVFYDTLKELGFEGSWEDDLANNIAKLRTRYPEKFTTENAINRNTEEELKHYE